MHQKRIRSLAVVVMLLVGSAISNELYAQSDADILDAAGTGNLGMMRTLLQLGGNPNAVDTLGNTALMYASQGGSPDVISALIDAGAAVDAVSNDGWTALLYAAYLGQADAAATLLAHSADPGITLEGGLSALIIAAVRGHSDAVDVLVAGGMQIDATLPDGRTALMAAAEGGSVEVVEKLLDLGADPNAQTTSGSTAASSALQNGHTEVAKVLAEADAEFMTGLASVEAPSSPSCPPPAWPDSLWEAEIEGQIVVEFVVGRDGETEDSTVTLISSPHSGLDNAAVAMFSACAFEPGKIAGTPARVRLRQGLNVGG
jgi:TonB family protein